MRKKSPKEWYGAKQIGYEKVVTGKMHNVMQIGYKSVVIRKIHGATQIGYKKVVTVKMHGERSHLGTFSDEGLPELKEALKQKLGRENNLHKSLVIVTTGANQKIQKAMPFSPLLPLTIVAMATAFRRSPHHKAKR
ncbi:hypothetical protein H5410_026988 [Solanum commersonii]|uniref:Uncharacterized protein n=1 Tax=Solanum commersonii TaxID=4109 RepID=A0A9J5Z0H6_SOLCO|nr:hypothetical protein H5410_026988 [Solanum commersonii]